MAENAAIIYMSRKRDLPLLYRSLSLLCYNFKQAREYPIIVFHDDITKTDVANLTVQLHRQLGYIPSIRFELLSFEMPSWVSTDESKYIVPLSEAWMGYRHMCRFHSGGIYRDERLLKYDWYWRLDSDSYIYSPISYDPFERMKNEGYEYAYMSEEDGEVPSVAQGLWEETENFLKTNNIEMSEYFKSCLVDGKWNYRLFYTNFEIAKFSFFRGKEYMDYFDHLDRTGNIYYRRWGDAPIHWLGVKMFLDPKKTWAVKDIAYHHNAWVRNLSAIPNKQVPEKIWQILQGDDYRTNRLSQGMAKYISGGNDGLNWGE
jgi:hypothetical protein